MASITFFTPDGLEKNWKLLSHRTMRVGRDPGSDIILRDARVSRHHAEILFERGFFVLRDLDSANGTFVNGKRIRNAPLTDGAELVLGDSRGRFTEELETQAPSSAVSVSNVVDDSAEQSDGRHTRPHQLPTAEGENKMDEIDPSMSFRPRNDAFASGDRFIFDLESNAENRSTVRDDDDHPIFVFFRPLSLVGLIAGLVSSTIILGGTAVALFLWQQDATTRALFAFALTFVFALVVLALVPRRTIVLRNPEADGAPVLTLRQENGAPAPVRKFLAICGGETVAQFHKNVFSNLGRRRWRIVGSGGESVGYAVEDSWVRAMLRKPFGTFLSSLRTDFEIVASGREIGLFIRRGEFTSGRCVLELRDATFDRRTAVALGLLLACVER